MCSDPVLGLTSANSRGLWDFDRFFFPLLREALLAEMGVAMREDGGTLGVFSPKKVGSSYSLLPGKQGLVCTPTAPFRPALLLLASPKYCASLFLSLKTMGEIPALTLLGTNIGANAWLNILPPLPGCCPHSGGALLMIALLDFSVSL